MINDVMFFLQNLSSNLLVLPHEGNIPKNPQNSNSKGFFVIINVIHKFEINLLFCNVLSAHIMGSDIYEDVGNHPSPTRLWVQET